MASRPVVLGSRFSCRRQQAGQNSLISHSLFAARIGLAVYKGMAWDRSQLRACEMREARFPARGFSKVGILLVQAD
jgi:hypothetical protein